MRQGGQMLQQENKGNNKRLNWTVPHSEQNQKPKNTPPPWYLHTAAVYVASRNFFNPVLQDKGHSDNYQDKSCIEKCHHYSQQDKFDMDRCPCDIFLLSRLIPQAFILSWFNILGQRFGGIALLNNTLFGSTVLPNGKPFGGTLNLNKHYFISIIFIDSTILGNNLSS